MSIETLMRGADAYTSLAEVAALPSGDGSDINTIIYSICTLSLDGNC
ncbi:hypothetical protein [Nonomuraea sp. NPDC003804]